MNSKAQCLFFENVSELVNDLWNRRGVRTFDLKKLCCVFAVAKAEGKAAARKKSEGEQWTILVERVEHLLDQWSTADASDL